MIVQYIVAVDGFTRYERSFEARPAKHCIAIKSSGSMLLAVRLMLSIHAHENFPGFGLELPPSQCYLHVKNFRKLVAR